MVEKHIIASYRTIHRRVRHGVWAEIHLYDSDEKMVGSLYFMDDDSDIRAAKNSPRIMIYYPDRRYPDIMNLLRSGSGIAVIYKSPDEAFITSLHSVSHRDEPDNDLSAEIWESSDL